jgi:hypothetical protein
MECLLLDAIFLTSSGFLVGAAVAPASPAEIAPAPAVVSGDGGTMPPSVASNGPG